MDKSICMQRAKTVKCIDDKKHSCNQKIKDIDASYHEKKANAFLQGNLKVMEYQISYEQKKMRIQQKKEEIAFSIEEKKLKLTLKKEEY